MSNTTRRKVRWDKERFRAYVVRDGIRYWAPQETCMAYGMRCRCSTRRRTASR